MSAAKSESKEKHDYRIHGGPWASAWKIAAGVGVVGLGGAFAGYASDPQRFAFSYLFAFFYFLTLAFGGLFFVLIQHLAAANWSITVRRLAEFFAGGFPAMLVLFVPVAMSASQLFPWWNGAGHHAGGHGDAQHQSAPEHSAAGGHGEGAAHGEGHGEGHAAAGHEGGHGEHGAPSGHIRTYSELFSEEGINELEHHEHMEIMSRKATFLDQKFFWFRVLVYFASWIFIAQRLFKFSTDQDKSKNPANSMKSYAMAPLSTFVFALTLTFASFDWVMSLLPNWYSTIFGVTIFAGSVVTIMATLILVSLSLKKNGILGDAVNTEHYHDLGKLMFGFTCFWAYVSFSQFFLTWYASIPEETVFYHLRWSDGPWKPVCLFIVGGHFLFPFWLLMSRNIKRRVPVLAFAAAWMLFMHLVEVYWLVLPNYAAARHLSAADPNALSFHWLDIACLLGVGGVYLALVFFRMTQHPVVPVGDPRLARSLKFENF